ncbi:uncharacterized protein LOC100571318 [Acyrthosiphon pisum]|uniref:BHLH domain-containing protein n=1 Tax=Acyrthosiphon pisum TaxID=7029 RepID=A0A8R1W500_ACYPI|nr:uncharacterized protein LOC100571318 [Acyrthosiphon pisum]|eukprot:XP_003243147.1 PREDICTED: uncharacterized protein LOC100571318 [Acyrthosiphon pisum]
MSKCLNNDSKIQMRLNIKRHRQKLLQYLENTNDTVLKPKIKLISNDIEKSNLNHNVNRKTRSSITVKQLQPNVKVKTKEEPLSNFELKLEPLPNIKIKDLEPSSDSIKKLREQLIKEELYDGLSSEENGDNSSDISVGTTEHFQLHNENDFNNSSIIEVGKYDGQEQLASDKSKEKYMDYNCDSDNPLLDINYPPTTKRKIMISKKPKDRDKHNAKEREFRKVIAKRFRILAKCCSYLNTSRRVPSKISILLAAKKECDLLGHFNKKMEREKMYWLEANANLKNTINELMMDRL